MNRWPDEAMLVAIRGRMRVTAARLRLPLRSRVWRGASGNWMGAGTGSSIDFQDHRQYQPGDDPRYIDWRTYARTDHYTMKLFREEVSPRVDIALDISASMFFEDAKRERALELFYFCVESAVQAGASTRCYAVSEMESVPSPLDSLPRDVDMARLASNPPQPRPPALSRVPWRQGALRALISDLLFAGSPEPLLALLAANNGRGVIFAPYSPAEAEPDLSGNVELIDCETQARRVQHCDAGLAQRYALGYERHFAIWREHCRRHAVLHARVAGGIDFQEALRDEALRSGAVELTR
jgi:uncharacterized protein (DUF58 family)